jgi:hypothetical protein
MTTRVKVALVRAYRLLPWRPRCRCNHPDGSCSERGLVMARAGVPLVLLLSVALACAGQTPDYNPLCGTGNNCTGTGKCEWPNSNSCPGQNPDNPPPAQPPAGGSGGDGPNSGHSPCPPGTFGAGTDNC